MNTYGCFNRAPFIQYLRVFDGYVNYLRAVPRTTRLTNVFTEDNSCKYSKDTVDQRCVGCKHNQQEVKDATLLA